MLAMVAAAQPPEPVELLPPIDPREQDRNAIEGGRISRKARTIVGPEGPRQRHLVHLAGMAFPGSIGATIVRLPDGRRLRLVEWIGPGNHKPHVRAVALIPPDDGPRWTIANEHPHCRTVTICPHLPPGLLAGSTVPDPDTPAGNAALADLLADSLAALPAQGGDR
ncbi:hypothetical protein LzC2_24970 [Planctomycetes bacterium LzC2]|uniref:Uncharacterized protein n=2 Tax=Alienimonas chondri TaxID=2681879 RepID=A0ABX1VE84_9PLAN|nr:hypothetical protein [Alienimonas chondri]